MKTLTPATALLLTPEQRKQIARERYSEARAIKEAREEARRGKHLTQPVLSADQVVALGLATDEPMK